MGGLWDVMWKFCYGWCIRSWVYKIRFDVDFWFCGGEYFFVDCGLVEVSVGY